MYQITINFLTCGVWWRRCSVADILQKGRPSYRIVDVFGQKGIPKLPIDERSAFASNYVGTARLSTEETNAVFQQLSR